MKLQPLVIIPSRHRTDCGIVAFATLTGMTYDDSLRLLLPFRKKRASYGVSNRTMEGVLSRLGYQLQDVHSNTQIRSLRDHALLLVRAPIKYYQRGWDYHFVVWDAKNKWVWNPGCEQPSYAALWQPRLIEGMTVSKM